MTTPHANLRTATGTALWRGFAIRCPHCGEGRTFDGLFNAHKTCSACGLLFEKQDGESVGGMYINLGIAEMLALGGFLTVHTLFRPPAVPHVIAWVIFNIVFCVVFYRHSRSLWMAISYVTGGVPDTDDTRSATPDRPPQ